MPRQCICTACKCGRHRCPHNGPHGNRVITKTEPKDCPSTEYGGSYSTSETKRGPFTKPIDQLVNDGTVDYRTTNKEQFKSNDVEMHRAIKDPEVYIPPTEKMNLVSEYNQQFINGGQNHKAVAPGYLKTVTQAIPSGRLDDLSTQKQDYKPWSASKAARVKPNARLQEYQPPSGPFDMTSTQRSDFKRHNAVAKLNGRIPDNLKFAGSSIGNDTTTRASYKAHDVGKVKLVHRTETYQPPSSPFVNNSQSRSDFQEHKKAPRAQIHKPISTLFHSTSPVQSQTTHHAEFKGIRSSAPAVSVKRQGERYQKPLVPMETKSTSNDYGSFDNSNKAARNARPKSNLRSNKELSFTQTTNYASDFPRHAVQPMKRATVPQERHTSASNGHFNGTSEHRDNFAWHSDKAPQKRRPIDEFPLSSERLNSTTQYGIDFPNHPREECPGKALLEGKVAGVTYDDDPDTGHRYVVMPPLKSTPVR